MGGLEGKKKKSQKSHTQIMHTYKTNKHNYTFYMTLQMAALRHSVNNMTITLLCLHLCQLQIAKYDEEGKCIIIVKQRLSFKLQLFTSNERRILIIHAISIKFNLILYEKLKIPIVPSHKHIRG